MGLPVVNNVSVDGWGMFEGGGRYCSGSRLERLVQVEWVCLPPSLSYPEAPQRGQLPSPWDALRTPGLMDNPTA